MKNQKNIFFMAVFILAIPLLTGNALGFDLGNALKSLDVNKVISKAKTIKKAFSDINEEEQYYIGRSVGAHLLSKYRLSGNGKLWDYMSRIGQNLALASERPDTFKGYHFILLDEPDQVNAFSVPSGFIFVTTGLISNTAGEDEFAGVLAHEIAHIVLYHPSTSIKKIYQDQIKKDLLSLAAEQVSASRKNQLIKGLVDGLNQVSGMLLDSAAKGYSREKEEESDEMAVTIMKTAGYDPTALAEVLKKLSPVGSGKSGTHGNPAKRTRNVLKFIKKAGSHPSLHKFRTKRFAKATR